MSDLSAGEPPRFEPTVVEAATPTGPWSALGSNDAGNGALNSAVYAIAASGTDLYVGGSFEDAAGIPDIRRHRVWPFHRRRLLPSLLVPRDVVLLRKLVREIAPLLPASAQVQTGAEQAAADAKDTNEGLSFITKFLLAFAGIARRGGLP